MSRLDPTLNPSLARQLAVALLDSSSGMAAGGGAIDLGALRRHLSDTMFSTDAGWENRAMQKVRKLIRKAVQLQRREAGGNKHSSVDVRAAAKRVFDGLDEDGNGLLSSMEFRRGLREHLGCKNLEMSELEGVLRLLDTNGDGSVDVEEFLDRLGFGDDGMGVTDSESSSSPYDIICLRNALRRFQLVLWEEEVEESKRLDFGKDNHIKPVRSTVSGEFGPLRRLFDKYAKALGSGHNNRHSTDGRVAGVGGARSKQEVGGKGARWENVRESRSTNKVLTLGQLHDMLVGMNIALPFYSSVEEDPTTGAKLISMEECACIFDIADRKHTGYLTFADFSSLFSLRSSGSNPLASGAMVGSISACVRNHLGKDEARKFRRSMRQAAPMTPISAQSKASRQRDPDFLRAAGLRSQKLSRTSKSHTSAYSVCEIDPTLRALVFFEIRDRLYRRHRTVEELFNALDRDRDGFVCPEDIAMLLSGGSGGDDRQGSFFSVSTSRGLSHARRMIAPVNVAYDPVLRLSPSLARAMLMQRLDLDEEAESTRNENDFGHGFVDLSTFLELLSLAPPEGNSSAYATRKDSHISNLPAGSKISPPPLIMDSSVTMDRVVEAIKARCDDLDHPNSRYTFALLVHATAAHQASVADGMVSLYGSKTRGRGNGGESRADLARSGKRMPEFGTGGLPKLLEALSNVSASSHAEARNILLSMTSTELSAGTIQNHCRQGHLTAAQLRAGLASVLNLYLTTERTERMLRMMNAAAGDNSSGSSSAIGVIEFVKRFKRVEGDAPSISTSNDAGVVAYDRFAKPGQQNSLFTVPMKDTANISDGRNSRTSRAVAAIDWKERAFRAIGIALRTATISFNSDGLGKGNRYRRDRTDVHSMSKSALRAVFRAKFSQLRGGNGGVSRMKTRETLKKEMKKRISQSRTGDQEFCLDDSDMGANEIFVTSASMLRDWLENRSQVSSSFTDVKRKNESANTFAARRNQNTDPQAARLRKLNPEGVTELRALRLPLKLSGQNNLEVRSSGGSWEDVFRAMDMDGDGLVSDLDFARAMLPYEARSLALASLTDLFFKLMQISDSQDGNTDQDMASLFRSIDRLSGASGLICGRDLVRFVSRGTVGKRVTAGPDQVWQWWNLVVQPAAAAAAAAGDQLSRYGMLDDNSRDKSLTFQEFESIFVNPFRKRMHVDYECATLSRLRKAVQSFQKVKGGELLDSGFESSSMMASQSTKFSLEEAFRLFDADGNGRLDSSELQRGLARFCGIHASLQEVELVLRALDTDEDGEISVDEFVRWIRPTDKEAEVIQRDNLRRQRITDLIYKFAGSPREAWFQVFRRAEKKHQKSLGVHVGRGADSGTVISLEGFTLGIFELFQRSRNMRSPSRMQCAAIFKAAGGVRKARLTRTRFLRYFEDPRKDPLARKAADDEKRAKGLGSGVMNNNFGSERTVVIRDEMGITSDALMLRDDTRVAHSGAIYADALSAILRNRSHLKQSLGSAVQRRIGMTHEERRRLVQSVRSSTLSSVNSRRRQRSLPDGRGLKRDGTRAGKVNRNLLFQGNRNSTKALVKSAAERLRAIKTPTRSELYEILKAPPLSLRLTVREWDELLDLGMDISTGTNTRPGNLPGVDDSMQAPLASISVKRFLDGCAKTQLKNSGESSWGGSKQALEEKKKARARAKEMEMRTRAPFASRSY